MDGDQPPDGYALLAVAHRHHGGITPRRRKVPPYNPGDLSRAVARLSDAHPGHVTPDHQSRWGPRTERSSWRSPLAEPGAKYWFGSSGLGTDHPTLTTACWRCAAGRSRCSTRPYKTIVVDATGDVFDGRIQMAFGIPSRVCVTCAKAGQGARPSWSRGTRRPAWADVPTYDRGRRGPRRLLAPARAVRAVRSA